MRKRSQTLALVASIGGLVAVSACGPRSVSTPFAADATGFQVFEQDYKLPAQVNPRILTDRQTELWARVYVPRDPADQNSVAPGRHPVLVFLHGNHGTCGTGTNPRVDDRADYTTTGTCPDKYVVTPNHRGYDYVARELAAQGYAVVSINANRGITSAVGVEGDDGLNLARGRLVLSHLELLSQWNQSGGSATLAGIDLKDHLDFANVGMMGHSRGGEGVRAAYAQYNDPGSEWPATIGPMTVKGIFEIGPVDGQTSRTLDALDTAWNVVIPMCDGDVSDYEGQRPFDRMLRAQHENRLTPKSTFLVWGANHNFFNTEWQTNDQYYGCADQRPLWRFNVDDPADKTNDTGSAAQRQIATSAMTAFFKAHVGQAAEESLGALFDPGTSLPGELSALTPIGRDQVSTPDASQTLRLVSYDGQTPPAAQPNNATTAVQALPFHEDRSGVEVRWQGAGSDHGVVLPFAGPTDLSGYATLDLSLMSRQPGHTLDFDVRLKTAGGASNALALSQAAVVEGSADRNLLQTVRIPLSSFTGVQLTAVTGVELVFDKGNGGVIILGGVRASKVPQNLTEHEPRSVDATQPATPASLRLVDRPHFYGRGQVTDAHLAQNTGAQGPNGSPATPTIDLTVQSPSGFPARDALPQLHVGSSTYTLSGYGDPAQKSLVFKIPVAQFRTLTAGSSVVVSYGDLATTTYVIDAGTLPQDVLDGVQ